MKSFQDLDSLLQTAFSDFQKVDNTKQFLSSRKILQELKKDNQKLINLENLNKLKKRLQLTRLEVNILFILFAPEINSKYARTYAYLQDNMNLTYPTVQLLTDLLTQTEEEKQTLYNYFIKPSKLSLLKLIMFADTTSNELLFKQALVLAPSTRNYLLGDSYLEGTLKEYCQIIEPIQEENQNLRMEKYIESGIQNSESYLLNIYGKEESSKQEEVLRVSSFFNFGLLHINTKELIEEEKLITIIPHLLRDAILTGTLLFFDYFDSYLVNSEYNENKLFAQLEQLGWLTFFSTTKPWNPNELPLKQNFYSFQITYNALNIQDYWQKNIAPYNEKLSLNIAPLLTSTFNFSKNEIKNVMKIIETEHRLGSTINQSIMFKACRSRISNNLNLYAQHIPSSGKLNDLVTTKEQKIELEEILSHYKYQHKVFQEWNYAKHFQSKGITLLFSGPSGTGKTMTASILANTLGLELYKIDLSQMISKYIGETEKNLSILFKEAKKLGVILLFDEADAVYGKRTEVNHAHDKYANMEVSYLLQKIEEYEGIIILTTNFKENIDEAFLRRIRFVIEFPAASEEQREELWKKLFAQHLLEKNINFKILAKNFKLTGANIRNISLFAAFSAASKNTKITKTDVGQALIRELEKIGMIINKNVLEGFLNQ